MSAERDVAGMILGEGDSLGSVPSKGKGEKGEEKNLQAREGTGSGRLISRSP